MVDLTKSKTIRNLRETSVIVVGDDVRSIEQADMLELTHGTFPSIRTKNELAKAMLVQTLLDRNGCVFPTWCISIIHGVN